MDKSFHQKRNPRDISKLQVTGKLLNSAFGLNFPSMNLEPSKPTRGKSEILARSTPKSLPISKSISTRYKKPVQGNFTPKLLHTYLQDAKASLKTSTRSSYLLPMQRKKYNILSLAEIECLLKEEKIDPSLAVLLKSANKLNFPLTEPTSQSSISSSGSPCAQHSIWSMSDTVLSSRPSERFKIDGKLKKEDVPFGVMDIGVPLAGRIITDKATFTAVGMMPKGTTSPGASKQSSEALLSAADDMINKVEIFVEKPKIPRRIKSHRIFGIPKSSSFLTDRRTTRRDIPTGEKDIQMTKDDYIRRLTPSEAGRSVRSMTPSELSDYALMGVGLKTRADSYVTPVSPKSKDELQPLKHDLRTTSTTPTLPGKDELQPLKLDFRKTSTTPTLSGKDELQPLKHDLRKTSLTPTLSGKDELQPLKHDLRKTSITRTLSGKDEMQPLKYDLRKTSITPMQEDMLAEKPMLDKEASKRKLTDRVSAQKGELIPGKDVEDVSEIQESVSEPIFAGEDYLPPEKRATMKRLSQVADYKDGMQQLKQDLKKTRSITPKQYEIPSTNNLTADEAKQERLSTSKRKLSDRVPSQRRQPTAEETLSDTREPISEHQDLMVKGKECLTLQMDAPLTEADSAYILKPQQIFANEQLSKLLDEEVACSKTLQHLWDTYEKQNKISEEVPTNDLESFTEYAKDVFEDFFDERKDKTGQLIKYVTFALKDQKKLTDQQAKMFIKEALHDPQMAELLMAGKKDEFLTKLKLLNLAKKLKGEETKPSGKAEIFEVMLDDGEQLKEAEKETADRESSLGKDTETAKDDSDKIMEKEKITTADETATMLKDVTAEELALKEGAESEELKKSDSSIIGKISEDVTGKSEVTSSPDISSLSEVLKKEADMSSERTSEREFASDIGSVVSKGEIVPESVSSVDSISTAVTIVYGDSSDADTTVSAEGDMTVSQKGPPAGSREDLTAVSKEKLTAVSKESLTAVSTEGLAAVSKESLTTVSAEGLAAVSTESLAAVSAEGLAAVPMKDRPLISVTTTEPTIKSVSMTDIPSAEITVSKDDDISSESREKILYPLKHTLSKEDASKVDALLAKYDSTTAKDTSLDDTTSGASTISSAYDAMATDGSFLKIIETSRVPSPTDVPVFKDNISAEDAFERAQKITQSLSKKYGLDDSTTLPTEPQKPQKKTKGKSSAEAEHPPITKKKSKSKLLPADKKPLPSIGDSKPIETEKKPEVKPLKKRQSAPKSDIKPIPPPEKIEKVVKKLPLLKRKSKKQETDEIKITPVFKDHGSKNKFIEMGLEKLLSMAKEKQYKKTQFDVSKKQFRDPIEVRDRLHARREQLHMLIMGMSDEKTIELENISQHELFEELETFEDEEINETLSLLTRVLHVEVADASPEMKSVVVSETKKKDDTKLKEKPQEKLERGMIEKEISRDYKPKTSEIAYKIPPKAIFETAMPVISQEALDENLFRNALLKMKTLNIFNAIKALGIANPQMKDFDDYIAQNKLEDIMDPSEIQHLRRAASEMFLFKGKSKKDRKKSLKSLKPKDLKKTSSLSESHLTTKFEEEPEIVDEDRIQKRASLTQIRQELEMISFEQRITEPYVFSYYIVLPDAPKVQKKPSKKKK